MNKLSLSTLGQGAAVEQFDIALDRAVENMMDLNTDQKTARVVTLEVKLKPNKERNMADVVYQVKTKLANDESIGTAVMFGKDRDGEIMTMELFPGQMPGQGTLPGVNPVTGEVLDDGKVVKINRDKEGTND